MNIKKIIVLLGVVVGVTLLTVGCEDQNQEKATSDETVEHVLAADSVEYEGQVIQLNEDIAEVVQALGEPNQVQEAPSCLFDGSDKTYTYEGITIITRPEGDLDAIESIRAMNSQVKCYKKLEVGNTLEQVQGAYSGETLVEEGMLQTYKEDKIGISYAVTDNVVTWIEIYVNR